MGAFLDLCAGTGAVGLEAYSRGFAPVVCIESGEPGWSCLQKNLAGSPIRALRADVRRLEPDAFRDQAVIFLDPPYEMASALWNRQSRQLRSWISPEGVLVYETDRNTTLELQPGWILAETREYGAARFHLWIPA
jgi:16S rRNA (guanine966-N2)-methyltransferase